MNNFVQCLKSWPVRHCTYSRLLVFINLFSSGACGLLLYATKHAVSYPFLSLEDSKPTARKHHVRVLHWTSLTILRRPVGSDVNWNSCYCFLFCLELLFFSEQSSSWGFHCFSCPNMPHDISCWNLPLDRNFQLVHEKSRLVKNHMLFSLCNIFESEAIW